MSNELKHIDSKEGKSIFARVENTLSKGGLFDDGVPTKYFPHIFFFLFLGVFYIGYTHYANKVARRTNKLKKEVEDLRADYTTMKANYMYESKLSEVAKKVTSYGLSESNKSPIKIKVPADEY
ncbi:MAG: FtsL-like putative cell division protein [Cyclobacteriaceae bacterium]